MSKKLATTVIALATATFLAVPTTAFAAPGGGGGGPGTGGGGGGQVPGGEETLGNNLSQPTYFVGGTTGAPTLRLPCTSEAVAPDSSDPTSTQFPGYYLQKTLADWTAACSSPTAASVTAKWGDNLLNGRALKAGKPIRVEMNLIEADAGADDVADTGTGFLVENLTPTLPDRMATYGTRGVAATDLPGGVFAWTAGAMLTIYEAGTTNMVVSTRSFSAEINSTGKVVYGFNWGTASGVPAAVAGTYDIVFSLPDNSGVTVSAVAAGEAGVVDHTAKTATVTVVVSGGGGSGGGKPVR